MPQTPLLISLSIFFSTAFLVVISIVVSPSSTSYLKYTHQSSSFLSGVPFTDNLTAHPVARRSVYVIFSHSNQEATVGLMKQMQMQLGVPDNVFIFYDDSFEAWRATPFYTTIRASFFVSSSIRGSSGSISNAKTSTKAQTRESYHQRRIIIANRGDWGIYRATAHGIQVSVGSQLLLFYNVLRQIIPDFEYLWQFEEDVRCNGDFKNCLLHKTVDMKEDFICVNPCQNTMNDTEWWWHDLQGSFASIPFKERWGCWVQMVRYSRRALDQLVAEEANREEKNSGFVEVYLSTVFKFRNISVGAFPVESLGRWVPNWLRYSGCPFHGRYKARRPTYIDDKLYHPIKE